MQFWKTRFVAYMSVYGASNKIEAIEVERATESSVWVEGRRRARVSDYDLYFETWDAAHAWLMERGEANLAKAHEQLNEADTVLHNIKQLKSAALA